MKMIKVPLYSVSLPTLDISVDYLPRTSEIRYYKDMFFLSAP